MQISGFYVQIFQFFIKAVTSDRFNSISKILLTKSSSENKLERAPLKLYIFTIFHCISVCFSSAFPINCIVLYAPDKISGVFRFGRPIKRYIRCIFE